MTEPPPSAYDHAVLTPDRTLRQWLLVSLAELGGSATRAVTLARIEAEFGHALTPEDKESPASRPWEAKWENRVSWARDHLVKEKLLAPFVQPKDPWALTATGWAACQYFLDYDAVADPLVEFHPKSSDDYTARISERTLIKRRAHEDLVRQFGEWTATRGYQPNTNVHPRDLVLLDGSGQEWLVEAKIIYNGNGANAVREALAQLLAYRHFLYKVNRPHLVALFNQPVGDEYVSFLESLKIEAVWLDLSLWRGSAGAALAHLV